MMTAKTLREIAESLKVIAGIMAYGKLWELEEGKKDLVDRIKSLDEARAAGSLCLKSPPLPSPCIYDEKIALLKKLTGLEKVAKVASHPPSQS